MNKKLQAEIWETQIWLMLILSLMLHETAHTTLFWIPLIWAGISFIGVIAKLAVANWEEKEANEI